MPNTINEHEAFALLVDVCPEARAAWEEHQRRWQDEDVPFIAVGVFARPIVDLMKEGRTESFPKIFEVIERLIVEGDEKVRMLATIGLLEDIQNIASWTERGYGEFLPWLGPSSREAWHEIERMWAGKSSLADVIREERRQQEQQEEESS